MVAIDFMEIDAQIEKLKSQNLTFFDDDLAKKCLTLFGYSKIRIYEM